MVYESKRVTKEDRLLIAVDFFIAWVKSDHRNKYQILRVYGNIVWLNEGHLRLSHSHLYNN